MSVRVSDIGKDIQVQLSPILDSSQNIGKRHTTWRTSDKSELTSPLPIAWKNTGIISEKTAGIKLAPIIGNAIFPISITCADDEKSLIIGTGIKTKQSVPKAINASAIKKEYFIVSRHRL